MLLNREPLVSIIVPVYNAQAHIARCIESIRKQTYQNIEIILLNDGSNDVSLPICQMFSNVFPLFHRYFSPDAFPPTINPLVL